MTSPFDYPAAHSMDTTWFAVDDDGHVAAFATWESGALPKGARAKDDGYGALEKIEEIVGYAEVSFEPGDFLAPSAHSHTDGTLPLYGQHVIVMLAEGASVADLLTSENVTPLPRTTPPAVMLTLKGLDVLPELHARNACAGCVRWGASPSSDGAFFGLFVYEHSDGWIAGPYTRSAVPAKPVTVAVLGDAVPRPAVRFPGRFADTTVFQPADHWATYTWERAVLSADGITIRPHESSDVDYRAKLEEHSPDQIVGCTFIDEALELPEAPLVDPSSRNDEG